MSGHCFCSAGGDGIGLCSCTGRKTAFYCCTNAWKTTVSKAQEYGRSIGTNTTAVPLADGEAEDSVAEGEQGGVRLERDLMPENTENSGFSSGFVVLFTYGI